MAVGGVDHGSATARAGIAGNPSDALGGAALAVPVAGLEATVDLHAAPRLEIRATTPERSWAGVGDLERHAARYGHEGAERLLTASIVAMAGFARNHDTQVDDSPFGVRWSTNIERSVGLAGSSALVVACLRALASRWQIDIGPEQLAALALDVESAHLGIAAGWMDRAAQAHQAPTLVDTRIGDDTRAGELPSMTVVRPLRAVPLAVAWDPAGAAPSGRLHAGLHDRLTAGDPVMRRTVDELVGAAHRAADALAAADLIGVAEAASATCGLRDRLGALDDATRALVAVANGAGAAATSAGSGGAVLVVAADGDLEPARVAFAAHGATFHPFVVPATQSRPTTSTSKVARNSSLDTPSRTS